MGTTTHRSGWSCSATKSSSAVMTPLRGPPSSLGVGHVGFMPALPTRASTGPHPRRAVGLAELLRDPLRGVVEVPPPVGPADVVEDQHGSGARRPARRLGQEAQLVVDRVPVVVAVDEDDVGRRQAGQHVEARAEVEVVPTWNAARARPGRTAGGVDDVQLALPPHCRPPPRPAPRPPQLGGPRPPAPPFAGAITPPRTPHPPPPPPQGRRGSIRARRPPVRPPAPAGPGGGAGPGTMCSGLPSRGGGRDHRTCRIGPSARTRRNALVHLGLGEAERASRAQEVERRQPQGCHLDHDVRIHPLAERPDVGDARSRASPGGPLNPRGQLVEGVQRAAAEGAQFEPGDHVAVQRVERDLDEQPPEQVRPRTTVVLLGDEPERERPLVEHRAPGAGRRARPPARADVGVGADDHRSISPISSSSHPTPARGGRDPRRRLSRAEDAVRAADVAGHIMLIAHRPLTCGARRWQSNRACPYPQTRTPGW